MNYDVTLISTVHEWQTLIAGVLASIAALATIAGIRDQIEADRQRSRDERHRTVISHRAVLPMVLSTLCDILEADLSTLRAAIVQGRTNHDHFDMPAPPPQGGLASAVETIRTVIEFEQDDQIAERQLRMLIAHLQIYLARRRPPHKEMIFTEHNLQSLALDCVELYAIASGLFAYSRPQDLGDFDLGRDRLVTAARNMHLWEDDESDGIMTLFNHRYPSGDKNVRG